MFGKIRQKITGNFQNQLLALLAASAIVPVALVGGFSIWSSARALSDVALTTEKDEVTFTTNEIKAFLTGISEDILFLSKTPPIQGIIRARANGGVDRQDNTPYDAWVQQLNMIFEEMIETKLIYAQLRYLDESGKEIVRVNFDENNRQVIAKSQLQNKASTDYFQETMKLQRGQVYVSDINLKRDGGVIAEPLIPIIRYATPIFDSAGNRRGILIGDVFADQFLKLAQPEEGHQTFVLNPDGYYLAHSDDSEREWGFDLPDNDAQFSQDFSQDIADEVLGNESGLITKDRKNLIVFSRILTGSEADKFIVVVDAVPKGIIFADVIVFWIWIVAIAIVALVVVFILGYFSISRSSNLVNSVKRLIGNISNSSEEIFANLATQEQTINDQASSVSQTTTTMDELGNASLKAAEQAQSSQAGANQALELAEKGNKVVEQSIEGITSLKDQVNAIAQQIMSLSEQTGQIANISTLVGDMASQTNMLALNAAVEAARAGEYGKGFSVVAVEIRKLADESKKSAEKISTLANEIQSSMNSTVMVTDEGTKKANESIKLVQTTAESFLEIKQSVNNIAMNSEQIVLTAKQQAVAIQEVISAMNEVNFGAQETASGINQVKVSTEELRTAALSLQEAV